MKTLLTILACSILFNFLMTYLHYQYDRQIKPSQQLIAVMVMASIGGNILLSIAILIYLVLVYTPIHIKIVSKRKAVDE